MKNISDFFLFSTLFNINTPKVTVLTLINVVIMSYQSSPCKAPPTSLLLTMLKILNLLDYLLNIDLDVLLLVLKISKPNPNSISLNKEKALITFNKKSFLGLQTFTVTQRLSLPQHFTDLFYNLKKII